MRRAGLIAVLALALFAPAASAVTQLGPPPTQGDCYTLGLQEGVNCFYGVGGMDFHNSPHILRVGQSMGVSMSHGWDSFLGFNGPVVRVVFNTLNYGDFEPVAPADDCVGISFFSTSTSCTLKAKAPTGGWRTHGYTLSIAGSNPYEAGDYYTILGPDVYVISGQITGRDPKTNAETPEDKVAVTVREAGGQNRVYSGVTNGNGRYAIFVEAATWKVSVGSKRFCEKTPSQLGCSRNPQVTTGPDRTIDFSVPKQVRISGKVKTKDGQGVKDVKIRARIDDTDVREAVSDKDGNYEIPNIPSGSNVVLDSTAQNVCPVGQVIQTLADGTCKPREKTFAPESDATVDFEKPGCVKTVDFKTSMIATGECFRPGNPDEWTTDEPFRMNGIDFEPGGEVKFDATSRQVVFTEGFTKVWLPLTSGALPLGVIPAGIGASFNSVTSSLTQNPVQFSANAGIDTTNPVGKAATKLAGWPISTKLSVAMAAGSALISGAISMPQALPKQYSVWNDGFTDEKGDSVKANKLSVAITSDNLNGARTLKVGFEGGFDSPVFGLTGVSASYDFPTEVWTFGGAFEPRALQPRGGTLDDPLAGGSASLSIEGSIAGSSQSPRFRAASVSANGINKPVNGALFLQRLRGSIAMQSLRDGLPFTTSLGIGLSLLGRDKAKVVNIPGLGAIPVWPAELVSVDGDFTLSWSKMTADLNNDVSISGKVDAKIWDQTVGIATLAIYPVQGLVGGSLEARVVDPTGGSVFALRGRGELWIDGRQDFPQVWMQGTGQLTLLGAGAIGDLMIVGPNPMMAGMCAEFFRRRVGFSYNYSTGQKGFDAQCDLSSYRALKPVAPVPAKAAAAAAGAKSFKVDGDEELLALEVAGTAVKLTGPGVSIASDGKKGVRKGHAMALPDATKGKVYFYVDKPRRGTYKLTPVGKGKLGKPRFATPLPEAQVDGELDASSCRPTLKWTAAKVAGQRIRFVERTKDGALRILGESKGTKGTLKIVPLPDGGKSEVSAQVLNGATVRATIPLGTYTSELGSLLPGPSVVRVLSAKKKSWKVAWTAACGALGYAVQVGKGKPKAVTGTSLTLPRPKKATTVTVTTLGRSNVLGGSNQVPLPNR